jgi:hypothetical protein
MVRIKSVKKKTKNNEGELRIIIHLCDCRRGVLLQNEERVKKWTKPSKG